MKPPWALHFSTSPCLLPTTAVCVPWTMWLYIVRTCVAACILKLRVCTFVYVHKYICVCKYLCLDVCMHACMHACVYVSTFAAFKYARVVCTYDSSCIHVCMCFMHIFIYLCVHICIYACKHTGIHTYMYISICTFTCVYMYVRLLV